MEGGSKGKIKEGPCPAAFHAKAPLLVQSSYSDVPGGCEGFGLISEPLAVHDLAIRKPPHLSEGEGRGDTALAPLPAERRARHDAIACVDQGVDLGVRVAELVV